MPIIAPTGVERLPMEVAIARSLSANQEVATFEQPFVM